MKPRPHAFGRNSQRTETDLVFLSADALLPRLQSFRFASYCVRNDRTLLGQSARFATLCATALLRPLLCVGSRSAATRLLYWPLRGMSRQRLDFLGEEYVTWFLRPRLHPELVRRVRDLVTTGRRVVLVSRELEQLVRPLAKALGAIGYVANRLDFREDVATGRLLEPIVPVVSPNVEVVDPRRIMRCLQPPGRSGAIEKLVRPIEARREHADHAFPAFGRNPSRLPRLSIRQTYHGKHILLLGATGFIGKVWLNMLLEDLPDIGRLYLLVRKSGSRSALSRFEKLISESPVFTRVHERHGDKLAEFIAARVEVLEGDIGRPQFGLDDVTARELHSRLDLIVNSSGQTDFNPDLRDALATNTAGVMHLLDFQRRCNHAAVMHLSTCFVSGRQDGRIEETIRANDCPMHSPDFDVDHEFGFVSDMLQRFTQQSEGPELAAQFRQQILAKHPRSTHDENGQAPKGGHGHAIVLDEKGIQHRIRKLRSRWLRERVIEFGVAQAAHWGWPNIYTYTKALGELLLHQHGGDLPITLVRPSIVESALAQPFTGWNEGVNGSAPITFLVDTHVRQFPANPRQQLDIIPVDLVCRGMTLVGAALMTRCHEPVYQLATSATNPEEVERLMELACLALRKHYWHTPGSPRSQRVRSDTIVVSQRRYQATSLPLARRWLERWQELMGRLGLKCERVARKLKLIERCEKIIELYAPFVHDNEFHFAADHIRILQGLLVPEERIDFGYEAESIDWAEYWINVHVPALRRWLYPVMEGRQAETGLPPRHFKLPPKSMPSAGPAAANGHTPVPAQPVAPVLQNAARNGD